MIYCLNIQPSLLAHAACFCFLNYETIAQKQIDTVQDRDGNIYTVKVLSDNRRWMTTNLKVNIPGSFSYELAEQDDLYGRLYTWKSAQEGCRLLGEDWRLPSNEEWQKMASFYGGVRDNSNDEGKSAYKALIIGGSVGFNAKYGGSRDSVNGTYARVNDHGFYWTATESDAANAWLYNFGKNGKILNRHHDGDKHIAISVRCIKNMSHKKNQ